MAKKVIANPKASNPTHEISLQDYRLGVTWGLRLVGGSRGLQEIPATASTVRFTQGGSKYGDGEPGMSHIEERTWEGGRGSDDFSADPTRFWDSKEMFTMVSGKAFPSLQPRLPTGLRTAHQYLPQDSSGVTFQSLLGDNLYVSSTFTVGGSNLGADNAYILLRRIGSPGTLTIQIWTNSSGSPGTLVSSASATTTTDTITDVISLWDVFDLSAAGDLTASTAYHIVVFGASADTATNHWEVGTDAGTDNSKSSSAGSSWSSSGFGLFYRVTDADTKREMRVFELSGALFAVDLVAAGTASTLYLNGELGKATGGSSTTLVDTDEGLDTSWADDQWNGYRIKITFGTGKGQDRLISDVTTADSTITVSSAWDITPDTTSRYVIYDGPAWQSFASGTTGLGAVKDMVILNKMAYFAQGSGDNIRRIDIAFGGSPPVLRYADDGSNKADVLLVATDPVDGPQMWRAENNSVDVSRATAVSATNNLAFGTEILVGDITYDIINMRFYDKKVHIFKDDGVYTISNDRADRINLGLDSLTTPNNGQAIIAHKLFLFFSWGNFSTQRMYGSTVDSVGYDVGRGVPSGRMGPNVEMLSHPVGFFACVDAGTGTSSVMFRDDVSNAWHEIFRAPVAGHRVRHIYWQDAPGTRPRLWIECNGELYYQEWPQDTLNPLEDSGISYIHESVLTLADIDLGAASLPKFIKELTLLTENLATNREIRCEVQVDNRDEQNIGGSTWTSIETFLDSPSDTLPINEGEVFKIRIRLRFLTNLATTPPILNASILEGYARTPLKYQWNMRIKVSHTQRTLTGTSFDHPPDDVVNWLKMAAQSASKVEMRSIFPQLDGVFVIVEPLSLLRKFQNNILKIWGGEMMVTVREA